MGIFWGDRTREGDCEKNLEWEKIKEEVWGVHLIFNLSLSNPAYYSHLRHQILNFIFINTIFPLQILLFYQLVLRVRLNFWKVLSSY
jgi:hypothetical protein